MVRNEGPRGMPSTRAEAGHAWFMSITAGQTARKRGASRRFGVYSTAALTLLTGGRSVVMLRHVSPASALA